MISKVFRSIAKFDVFGQTITLRMNKQNFYKTAFGGFVSLLLFFTMVIIFTQNLISFYNKENLTATVLTSFEETPSLAILNDQNFVFAVQIEQDNFIKNPFFQITIQQRSEIRYQNGSKISNNINLQLIPCTIDRFQTTFTKRNLNITQQFKDLDLQNFLCLDLNTTYQIQGTNTNSIYNFLKISVNSCDKSQHCATDEDRKAHILINGSYKLKFYTINSIINPQHPDDEYIQIFIDDSFYLKFLPSDIYKTVDVFLKEYNIYNDDSLTPFSDISLSSYYILDQSAMSEKVEFNSNNTNELATLFIRKSPYKTYVYRSYLKIDELLSNLGGIQQIFFFFLGVILSLYNRFQCNKYNILVLVELANKLFEFQLISLQHEKIEAENLEQVNQLLTERNLQMELQSKRQSDLGLQINQINLSMIKQQKNNNELKFNQNTHNNNEAGQNLSNQLSNKNEGDTKKFFFRQSTRQSKNLFNINQLQNGLDYFQQQIYIIINRSQPILLSFTMIINFITCHKCFKNKKNIQLMNKAIDSITDQIDLFNILTKLNELEKIKEVIFTPEQQLIFGFTPKPLISLDMTKVQINRQYLQSMNQQQTTQNDEQQINPIQKAQRGMHLKGDQQLYQEIYAAYDEILQDQDQDIINKQLIKKLGPEVQKIFKLSKLMDQQKRQNRTQVRKKLIKHDDDMLITD